MTRGLRTVLYCRMSYALIALTAMGGFLCFMNGRRVAGVQN
ncbi:MULTISPECIES: hypothetical protein [Pseudomonas]|nr:MULTISPECIES: hypothetical protein [Pseudomonas]